MGEGVILEWQYTIHGFPCTYKHCDVYSMEPHNSVHSPSPLQTSNIYYYRPNSYKDIQTVYTGLTFDNNTVTLRRIHFLSEGTFKRFERLLKDFHFQLTVCWLMFQIEKKESAIVILPLNGYPRKPLV